MKYAICSKCKTVYSYDIEEFQSIDLSPCCQAELMADLFKGAGLGEERDDVLGRLDDLIDSLEEIKSEICSDLSCDYADDSPAEIKYYAECIGEHIDDACGEAGRLLDDMSELAYDFEENINNFEDFEE